MQAKIDLKDFTIYRTYSGNMGDKTPDAYLTAWLIRDAQIAHRLISRLGKISSLPRNVDPEEQENAAMTVTSGDKLIVALHVFQGPEIVDAAIKRFFKKVAELALDKLTGKAKSLIDSFVKNKIDGLQQLLAEQMKWIPSQWSKSLESIIKKFGNSLVGLFGTIGEDISKNLNSSGDSSVCTAIGFVQLPEDLSAHIPIALFCTGVDIANHYSSEGDQFIPCGPAGQFAGEGYIVFRP